MERSVAKLKNLWPCPRPAQMVVYPTCYQRLRNGRARPAKYGRSRSVCLHFGVGSPVWDHFLLDTASFAIRAKLLKRVGSLVDSVMFYQ